MLEAPTAYFVMDFRRSRIIFSSNAALVYVYGRQLWLRALFLILLLIGKV
jgi:hypothetical protein